MVPYKDDRFLVDYGEGPTGVYSDSKVKQVAWVKHYEKFWVGAGGFCGWRWPMCITNNTADRRGRHAAGRAQILECRDRKESRPLPTTWKSGHKIYTLDRSIWVLQGRHRDMEVFPDYVYDQPGRGGSELPMVIDGQWKYDAGQGRRAGSGKRLKTSKPGSINLRDTTLKTAIRQGLLLKGMGLTKVADLLEKKGKLG